MNTRVRGRKDLENLTIPFIGEIPLFTRKKKGILGKKPQEVKAVIVKEGNRDIINEAFRVLRTNLEFYDRQGQDFECHHHDLIQSGQRQIVSDHEHRREPCHQRKKKCW